jgi:hypothetical protein
VAALLPGPLVAGPADSTSGKWQATVWPVASSRIGGCSATQTSWARGHRVRNRQPLGGWTGDGGSPLIVVGARLVAVLCLSVLGTESSRARV